MGGKKNPFAKEKVIYEFVKEQTEPISFHEINKYIHETYGFSVGATQAALERCLKEGAYFPLYETKIISSKTKRDIRVFSAEEYDLAGLSTPNTDDLLNIYEKIETGDVIFSNSQAILPLYLSRNHAFILQRLVELSSDYSSIGDLFSKAVMGYLANNVPKDLLAQAVAEVKEEE